VFALSFVRRVVLVTGALAICLFTSLSVVEWMGVAWAVQPAPALQVTTLGVPSVLPPGEGREGKYDIIVENIGGATSQGVITVKDDIPRGLTVTDVRAEPEEGAPECSQVPDEVTCSFTEPLVSSGFFVVDIRFVTNGAVGTLQDNVSVAGGGSASATGGASIRVGAEHERGPAGISEFNVDATGPAGEAVTQAGGHPHFLTTTVQFHNMFVEGVIEPTKPVEAIKDLVFYLPLGMLGNPAITDLCPASIVETRFGKTGCPLSSRVGTILPMISGFVFADSPDPTHAHGIYSVAPEQGYVAEFAFTDNNYTFFTYVNVVRRNGAYMLRVAVPGVPPIAYLIGMVATFYGDVQERYLRGEEEFVFDRGSFLSDPTDCGEGPRAREASIAVNTWEHPDPALPISASAPVFSAVDGCELLGFSSKLAVSPETTRADAPSGYEFGFEFPQAPNGPSGLATPPERDVSVTLPEGTTVSPSSADGLRACQETGVDAINIEGPESEAVAADGLERPVAGRCPLASQVATVEATTPLLREALTGHVFLAAPRCGGVGQHECSDQDARDGGLFGLYLELEAPNAGVVIKLEGHASLEPGTGRITAVFDDAPQFPVSKLVVKLKRGPHAPLANPQGCGAASTSATIVPWSEPATAASTPSSVFSVDWDGAGGACPASMPFAPAFVAGTVGQAAGSTSPFSLTLTREDREQNVLSLTSTLPKGLLANLSRVARCPEPQASQASLVACPAASGIGTVAASVGPGSDPYQVTGKVFLTGPYNGAPFGLSVVVPAVAGPFNLGDVLVRVALFVDPRTLQVTAQSAELPGELDGVPLRIRTLEVTLDAHEFTLNPTSCAQLSVTGEVRSRTGATAAVASPFATSGCKNLAFKAALSGSTQARSTKADGTGVKIKVAYPSGGEANLAKLVLSFPKQLPVRLETLRQACRAATFEANPAACPAASNIATATVHTPLLSQPVVGPAYLVSYGSAKFPDVVFVLQGEGITLELDAQSVVSKGGVLTATAPAVPDAPFSAFESTFPAGRYSMFTSTKSTTLAEASQCGESLRAPVTMLAQNGAEVNENPKLAITGCKTPPLKITLLRAKPTTHGLALTITTSTRGRLKINGAGLKTLERNIHAGTHKLTVALTHAGQQAATTHKKTQINLTLTTKKQKTTKHKKIAL
jgi:hypothetical protein